MRWRRRRFDNVLMDLEEGKNWTFRAQSTFLIHTYTNAAKTPDTKPLLTLATVKA